MKYLSLLIIILGISIPSKACRFTVREIGFSTLSQTNYTFVVIDNEEGSNPILKTLQRYKKDSNIGVVHLNERNDKHNPIVQLAKEQMLSIPSVFLLSPDNRIYLIEASEQFKTDWQEIEAHFTETVLDSPLRQRLRESTESTFAHVICIDGLDEQKSQKAFRLTKDSCKQLEGIMPLMPKEVKNPPVVMRLTRDEFKREQVLLWSLGVDSLSVDPQAIIVYGRGRIMGSALNYEQIKDNLVFKYLSMIGADCECGLDRKWMLGVQIPMIWDADCRQRLAAELGFDVDNPTILAEMSRILAKETIGDIVSNVGYGLEAIDINKAFGVNDSKPKIELVDNNSDRSRLKSILISLSILITISVVVSIVIIRRKKAK